MLIVISPFPYNGSCPIYSMLSLLAPAGRGASELRKAAVDGDFAGGHEATVRRCEKGSHGPISAGSAMRWSGVIAP